ncbi:hypothetical protein THAOC_08917, partial [Thalassiosira oceanica]
QAGGDGARERLVAAVDEVEAELEAQEAPVVVPAVDQPGHDRRDRGGVAEELPAERQGASGAPPRRARRGVVPEDVVEARPDEAQGLGTGRPCWG